MRILSSAKDCVAISPPICSPREPNQHQRAHQTRGTMGDSPGPRSKRQKIDKGGRFAALARLKDLKGAKNKLHIDEEVDNVYDTVDEREYEKMVLARADDNWIVDDGTGYVDDGREIFDDEYDDGSGDGQPKASGSTRSNKASEPKSKKRLRDINAPTNEKSNIKRLFGNAAANKKSDVGSKLAEDDILSDILGEMDTTSNNNGAGSSNTLRPNPISALRRSTNNASSEKKRVSQFMQGFASSSAAASAATAKSDDAMLDEMLRKQKPKSTAAADGDKPKTEELSKASRIALLKPKAEPVSKPIKSEEIDPLALDDPMPISSPADDAADMDFSILDDDENQFEVASSGKSDNTTATTTTTKATHSSAPNEPHVIAAAAADETESYDKLLQHWENTCNMKDMADEFVDAGAEADFGDSSTAVRFWFWDAWEDPYKKPGQIYLFGKIAVEGKTPPEFKSACIKVENIERCLYLLPREYALDPITKRPTKTPVKFLDVYNEFNETIAPAVNVSTYRSRKVSKNFAFSVPDVAVPATCDYLEVRYEGNKPAPSNKHRYNHVGHIFGTATNALETFLLEAKIKGPCWLTVSKYTVSRSAQSWCQVELTCPNAADCIAVCMASGTEKLAPPPPLVLTTLNVQTALNPKTTKNEVIMIAVLVNRSYSVHKPSPSAPFQEHFCGFTRPIAQNWPHDLAKKLPAFRATRTHKLDSERALLSWFLATFQRIDPDLIVIHDANDCQLDVICDRVAALKIPMWSRIGRLRMSAVPTGRRFKDFFVGRMVCDVKQSAEELIKSRSYDLGTLCQLVLKTADGDRVDVDGEEIPAMYESADEIFRLVTLTMQDAAYVLRLMCELNVLPLALQITNVCGNLLGRTLQGGRSERNEWLLLHAFVEKNYIAPDRRVKEWNDVQNQAKLSETAANATGGASTTSAAVRKKPQYSGGLVLEPIKGFYDKFVLLMDFNSLYPSIIQEYNICFTTIEAPPAVTGAAASEAAAANEGGEPQLPELPDSAVELGVLPRQIRRLVESRREVKKLMAAADCDADQRAQYNIRQTALKLTANSMYGCLGFTHSRFFAPHLAALVTFKGREILLSTKSLVQKLNHQVIYGDTDSIMINTNSTDYDQVQKVGAAIKLAVNKMYRQVELDVDGVFKYLLLLKKKKYAAVTIARRKGSTELVCAQEHKGLDIVRRDWSQISAAAGKVVLDELLSDLPMDDRLANVHGHLERFRASIEAGTVPLSLLAITKQLTKAPTEYASAAQLPHVLVALRMNAERNRRYKKGDMVAYVICTDGTDRPAMQRAYHVDELKAGAATTEGHALKVDALYYLAQQIHPVVSRLCEPIEGTDASRIASCLGLDPAKFKAAAGRVQRERAGDTMGEAIVKTTAQKYRDCERFTFKCPHCGAANLVASAYRRTSADQPGLVPVLEVCANSECGASPAQLIAVVRNQLQLAMRTVIRRFYENWLVCDEPNCSSNTRVVTHVLSGSRPVCMSCKQGVLVRQYGERELFAQLSYYRYMFDVGRHEQTMPAAVKLSPEVLAAYATMADAVETVLSRSAFGIVKLAKLFPQLAVDEQPPSKELSE